MATQQMQRPSSRKAKFSTTTEQVETGMETAPGEDSGDGGLANNEDTGRDEPQGPKFPATAGAASVNEDTGRDEPRGPKLPATAGAVSVNGGDGVDDGYWGLIEKKLVSKGLTKKELTNLRPTSVVTNVGEPYCPNPESDNLLRGYKTLVKAIQRPEMRHVEKIDFIKEIKYEPHTIQVPKTSIEMDRIVHKDQVIVVRKVAKKIPKTFYRVVEEVREVTEMVDVVEYIDMPWTEEVPRFTVGYVPEIVNLPVVREKRVPRTEEEPTGKFCNVIDGGEPKRYDNDVVVVV